MRNYETAGHEAERELTAMLGREGRLYREDILLDALPRSLRLSSSYEELLAWWNEAAYVRPGFAVAEGFVDIPCFLAIIGRADEVALLEQLQMPTQSDIQAGKLFFSSLHLLERQEPAAAHNGVIACLSPFKDELLQANAEAGEKEQIIEALLGVELKPLAGLSETRKRAYLSAMLDALALWLEMKPATRPMWRELLPQLIFGCERIVSAFSGAIYQDQVVKCAVALRQDKAMHDLAALRLLLMHYLSFDVLLVVKGSQNPLEAHLPKEMFDYHLYRGIGNTQRGQSLPWRLAIGAAALVTTAVAGALLLL